MSFKTFLRDSYSFLSEQRTVMTPVYSDCTSVYNEYYFQRSFKTLCSGVETVLKGDWGFMGNVWICLFVCVVWRRVRGD